MTNIFYFASIIIWLFPAVRQYKQFFFYYFLIMAITDPINGALILLLGINPFETTIVYWSYVSFMTVLERKTVKKYWMIFTIPFIVMLIINFTTDWIDAGTIKFLFIMMHVVIFTMILKIYAFDQTDTGTVKWFYIVLLFYELTIISKFIAITIGIDNATGYFIVTTFVQAAFGLFFSVFREDDPRLVAKLQ